MYGLGANDAKGCLSAMCVAFAEARLTRGKLLLVGACEEETGRGGAEIFLPTLPPADQAIVGEPTGLDLAVAQNGMLILDCAAHGKAGHAARPHLADNAIYRGARDVLALQGLHVPPSICNAVQALTADMPLPSSGVIDVEVRAVAVLALGKIATSDSVLARRWAPAFARSCSTHSCPLVRNNAMLVGPIFVILLVSLHGRKHPL
jgi:hypothetical protein